MVFSVAPAQKQMPSIMLAENCSPSTYLFICRKLYGTDFAGIENDCANCRFVSENTPFWKVVNQEEWRHREVLGRGAGKGNGTPAGAESLRFIRSCSAPLRVGASMSSTLAVYACTKLLAQRRNNKP